MEFNVYQNVMGYGDGKLGNITITTSTVKINSYAKVTAIDSDRHKITLGPVVLGDYGGFSVGDNILFHVTGCLTADKSHFGKYLVTSIAEIENNNVTLSHAIPEGISLDQYLCQIVNIPQFNTLVLKAQISAQPFDYAKGCGGIIIAKAKISANISNGGFITEGAGLPTLTITTTALETDKLRPAGIVCTNLDLTSKWMMSQGNGIAVIITPNLIANENSRLGATWSGNLGQGVAANAGGKGSDAKGVLGGAGGNPRDGNWSSNSLPQKLIKQFTQRGYAGRSNWDKANYGGATVIVIADNITGFTLHLISTGGRGGNNWNFGEGQRSSSGGAGYGGGGGCGDRGGCYISSGGGAGYALIVTKTTISAPQNKEAYEVVSLISDSLGKINTKIAFDCTKCTNIEGFNIEGIQPENCDRKLIFKVDGIWYKLKGNEETALEAVKSQNPTVLTILEEGNNVEELNKITDIKGFLGKQVDVAVALKAPAKLEVMPTLKIELKTRNNQDQFQKVEYSAEYELYDTEVDIINITPDVELTGQAEIKIQVSLKRREEWTEYIPILEVKGEKASALKFKAVYTVTTLDGTDIAKINSVICTYRYGNAEVSGTKAELMTITQNYENPLHYVRCHVIHDVLQDAQIKAYVSFREKPKTREMLNIATGNNDRQLVQLEDKNINHNTLQLFYDGKPIYDFDYNTELSQVLFTAGKDVAVTANYEYGWEKEEWFEMEKADIQRNLQTGMNETSFFYELPTEINNKTISVVKLELLRPEGEEKEVILGKGNGKSQLYLLPHYAKLETIMANAQFSYDEDSRLLKIVGEQDQDIKISYKWSAETQKIYGLIAAWNE